MRKLKVKKMAIQLYKPGKKFNVRGVECDVLNTTIGSLQYHLDDGWFKTPGEWDEPAKTEPEETEPEETEPDAQVAPAKSIKEDAEKIRQAAKEAGIDGFEKKRISTLKDELNDIQNTGDK